MRKYFLLFLAVFILSSCSKDDSEYSHIFRNTTSFTVVVTPHPDGSLGESESPFFQFQVPPGETKTFSTDGFYALFEVQSNESDLNFNYKLSGDTNVIYAYEHKVLYVIKGTARSADITYNRPNGATGQTTVTLPSKIAYDEFGDSFLYISAQNNGESGGIEVEIYYEDELKSSDRCGGAYCIATASN